MKEISGFQALLYPYQVDKKYVGLKYGNYKDDAITKVSADGEILFQKSITNHLYRK